MTGTVVTQADSTTLVLNGTVVNDFIAGDILELTPVNPATSHINGTGGGVNINARSDAGVHDLTIRVQKMSASDVFLNSALNQSAPVVFDGTMKEDFIRDGIAGVESYILESGSITTQPTNTVNDQDGNALRQYTIRFRNAQRNL